MCRPGLPWPSLLYQPGLLTWCVFFLRSYNTSMTNNRYILAIDPSGRATCRGKCKTKIEKGVVRFGSIAVAREWDGDITFWRHLGQSCSCTTSEV